MVKEAEGIAGRQAMRNGRSTMLGAARVHRTPIPRCIHCCKLCGR